MTKQNGIRAEAQNYCFRNKPKTTEKL